MNVNFDYQLKNEEVSNPILETNFFEDSVLNQSWSEALPLIFPHNKHQLKTWGNSKTSECHYIAVQKQTPLHRDPKFPKYTHHYVLYSDNFVLRGLDKKETPIKQGLYFVLDGHSPHQLLAKDKEAKYYLAVSYDSNKIQNQYYVFANILSFLKKVSILNNLNNRNLS